MASRLSDDDPLVSRFKALFPDKSLKTLYEIFTDMAQSVYKKQSSASVLSLVSLNLIEFKIAMVRFKSAKLSFEEIRRIFLWLDSDHGNHNGRVEYDEFVAGVRGELPPHLRRMVLYVFRRLDRNMNGYVEEKELAVHLRKVRTAVTVPPPCLPSSSSCFFSHPPFFCAHAPRPPSPTLSTVRGPRKPRRSTSWPWWSPACRAPNPPSTAASPSSNWSTTTSPSPSPRP